jgi:SAM-dependent methyltransferase
MSLAELRMRARNGFRDHVLYADRRPSLSRRARVGEVARNLAIAAGRTTFRGRPVQFEYHGFTIPHDLALMTGGGEESWDAITAGHLEYYRRWSPISPAMSILEIGCGIGRDAIALVDVLDERGRYVGLDVVRPSTEWSNAHIARRHPNFEFVHLDVRTEMYNPSGAFDNADVVFPVDDDSFDLVVAHSVFTHMFRDAVTRYLVEIGRVLRRGGLVNVSFFVVDDESLANAASTEAPLTFGHEHAGADRNDKPDRPENAVAFRATTIREMAATAGLRVRSIEPGFWSGLHPDVPNGQDIVILEATEQNP